MSNGNGRADVLIAGGQFGISTAGDQPAECRLLHEASLCRYLRPDVSASK